MQFYLVPKGGNFLLTDVYVVDISGYIESLKKDNQKAKNGASDRTRIWSN